MLICELPDELCLYILNLVGVVELANIRRTNRFLRDVVNTDLSIWHRKIGALWLASMPGRLWELFDIDPNDLTARAQAGSCLLKPPSLYETQIILLRLYKAVLTDNLASFLRLASQCPALFRPDEHKAPHAEVHVDKFEFYFYATEAQIGLVYTPSSNLCGRVVKCYKKSTLLRNNIVPYSSDATQQVHLWDIILKSHTTPYRDGTIKPAYSIAKHFQEAFCRRSSRTCAT